MHGNGECEVSSPLLLKHLVWWIWTALCYASQRLGEISSCLSKVLWSIQFSFSFAVPLFCKSIQQLVVFEDMKWNRDSRLTLKIGYKLICCGTNFKWRKSEHICDDRRSVIRECFNISFAFWHPVSIFGYKWFKKVHTHKLIILKVFIHINRKKSKLFARTAL